MARARRILVAAALAAAGCTLVTEFWTQDEATPVYSLGSPSTYQRSGFGAVLAADERDLGPDGPTTLLAASAGIGSATETYHWAKREGLQPDPHLTSVCSPLGDGVDPTDPMSTWGTCEASGTGAALLWLPTFRPSGDPDCLGALVVGQPLAGQYGAGRLAVHCPQTGRTVGLDRGDGPTAHFGRALALVRGATGPFVAVGAIGAVWISDGPLDGGSVFRPTIVSGVNTPSFGLALAGGAAADGRGWVAVGASTFGQTDPSPSRVVLLRTDPGAIDATSYRAAGCIEDAAQSPFGTAVLAHDFDGDGNDELVYRTATAVRIADGASIAALTGGTGDPRPCAFDSGPGTDVPCPPTSEFGVECSEEYGAAIAAGDLNLDGRDELLVGDPGAIVSGAGRAGAVHVFENDGTGWRRTGALFDASPSSGARVGTAVAVAPVRGRPEPFVGAAGSSEVFVFYCSGLEGDKPRADDPMNPGHRLDGRCLGQ